MTFKATTRSGWRCRALKTAPIPPRAISASNSYPPKLRSSSNAVVEQNSSFANGGGGSRMLPTRQRAHSPSGAFDEGIVPHVLHASWAGIELFVGLNGSTDFNLARSPAFRRQDVRPAKAGTPCQPPFMVPKSDSEIVEATHEAAAQQGVD